MGSSLRTVFDLISQNKGVWAPGEGGTGPFLDPEGSLCTTKIVVSRKEGSGVAQEEALMSFKFHVLLMHTKCDVGGCPEGPGFSFQKESSPTAPSYDGHPLPQSS